MLGAFYMATDMVTTPLNRKGSVVFAVGCGILTCVIRLWGSYPEGVSFSILIMNALTPLIDKFTAGRPFGK
jgi:electron transport complex protein RnfD